MSQYCDVDTYGDWEEIALPKTSLIADLGDYDTWPNGVARYRLYILRCGGRSTLTVPSAIFHRGSRTATCRRFSAPVDKASSQVRRT